MTDTIETPDPRPELEAGHDRDGGAVPTAGALILFASDDELLCVDDTCVPAGSPE